MSSLNDVFNTDESMDSKQKIVEELLNSENNLDTKTELNQPLKWACLDLIQGFIGSHELPNSEALLDKFMKTSKRYMISSNRQGRKEYIQALESLARMDEKRIENTSLMS